MTTEPEDLPPPDPREPDPQEPDPQELDPHEADTQELGPEEDALNGAATDSAKAEPSFDPAKDYYDVLEVAPNATPAMISAAYDALARKYHPDLTVEPEAPERMRELDEAFDVLDNPERRDEYDRRWERFRSSAKETEPALPRDATFWRAVGLIAAGLASVASAIVVLVVAVLSDGGSNVTTTDSGLQFVDLEQGTGDTPQAGQTVVVHYEGKLEDGSVFDSSLDGGAPFEFILGTGEVIQGWDEGIATMKVGALRQLIIPPNLAYGDAGFGNVIPPNATLTFEVRLVEIK